MHFSYFASCRKTNGCASFPLCPQHLEQQKKSPEAEIQPMSKVVNEAELQPKSKIASEAAMLLGIKRNAVGEEQVVIPPHFQQAMSSTRGSPLLPQYTRNFEGPQDQAAGKCC